ncbi:MAG: hypothetical protein QXY26_04430 [Ignisphaera sp.]
MNILMFMKRVVRDKFSRKRIREVNEIINRIEYISQHYKKVIDNCINYLTVFSNIVKPYVCMKCNKVFFTSDNEKRCPFCNSLYIANIDIANFKAYIHSYCDSLYGRNLVYTDVFKDVAKNLCLDKVCYFLESSLTLEIFTEKGILRISSRNEKLIEVELPWVDTSVLAYIDEITAIVFQHREKLLKNGTRYIVYKASYSNISISYALLIRERFMDTQFFKHFIDKLGLNKYILNRGILTKIFDMEYGEYIDPQKMAISTRTAL